MHLKELTTAHFQAAEEGTTTEINGQTVKIDGYLITEDNSFSIPCIHMMTPFRERVLCLIDRAFHPEKNALAFGEDVPKVIERLISQLCDMAPEEDRKALRQELESIVEYAHSVPDENKLEAEKFIINATRGTVKNNAK